MNKLLSKEEMAKVFSEAGVDVETDKKIVCTCGSVVHSFSLHVCTCCELALGVCCINLLATQSHRTKCVHMDGLAHPVGKPSSTDAVQEPRAATYQSTSAFPLPPTPCTLSVIAGMWPVSLRFLRVGA